MSAKRESESFDIGAGKLAVAIIVGVYALQLGLAGMHLYFSQNRASQAPAHVTTPSRGATALAGVQACASPNIDIAVCEVAVTQVIDQVRNARRYCPPPGDSRSPASIVRRYLVEHPAAAAAPLEAVLAAALEQAWPCGRDGALPPPLR